MKIEKGRIVKRKVLRANGKGYMRVRKRGKQQESYLTTHKKCVLLQRGSGAKSGEML